MSKAASQAARLAISRPLLAWLREDKSWAALPLATRARLHWQAYWGSTNLGLSRQLDSQAPAVKLADPLLIVGLWRSGTTVMHELLAAASGCATPLTWQCMDPCAFRLTGSKPQAGKGSARPMDGLLIHAGSPQEDEFALLGAGIDSAYRGFWMPHRLMALAHTLDPDFWLQDSAWLAEWQAFLAGVLRTSAQPAQPLILKSPNHSFRLPALLRQFPQAKLVWMMRDPARIVHSNRKMWTQMCQTHGLSLLQEGELDSFINVALDRAAQVLEWCCDTLQPGQLTVVSNEALLADPALTLRSLWQRAQLPMKMQETALAAAIAQTATGRVDSYSSAALPQFEVAIQRLQLAQDRAESRFGLPQR